MSTDQERRVAGKVVVITGAASGMGRAGAILLARHGAKVVATDRDVQGLAETLRLVREAGGDIVTTAGDVSSWDDNQRFVEVAKKEFGRLDAMWANAGIPQSFRPIGDVDPQELDRQFSVNARGPWLAAKSAIAELARTKGSLLITASLSGIKGRADASAYQAAKGAAVMLTKSLAKEFGPLGVRVNALCPLATETPMWAQFMEGYLDPEVAKETFAAAVPLGRFATVDDVANAALFLLSDDASFISGVNLTIDGGASA